MNYQHKSKIDINIEKFDKICSQIIERGTALFPEYAISLREGYNCIDFINKNDSRIKFVLKLNTYSGKINVYAAFYNKNRFVNINQIYVNNQPATDPECGFSIDRTPDAIIKGIQTRFLPSFNIIAKAFIEQLDKETKSLEDKNQTLREVCAALNMQPQKDYLTKDSLYHFVPSNDKDLEYIDSVSVLAGNAVKINIPCLPKKKALKVISLLRSLE